MKKIGILFGQENTFPQAFVECINRRNVKGIHAELALIEEVVQGKPIDYAVIIDRISQDVPFYRSMLKNAALQGTTVINNPFWWSADEKFFNNCLSEALHVPVPRTILLPSKKMPDDTTAKSFRNLKFPLEWEKMVEYLGGFPLFMKPHSGGGWKSVYKVHNMQEMFKAYDETEQLVMMLQETIDFEAYFRCYYLGGDRVHIMPYEPRNDHFNRYIPESPIKDKKMLALIKEYVIRLNHGLGYAFNTVEFAVRDGIPYAIDFCNPAPDADFNSVGQANFDWVVNNAADMAIEYAKKHKEGKINMDWGNFLKKGVQGKRP